MQRRRFFHWCSFLLSGLAAAFVAVPGASFLMYPLSRGTKKGKPHRLLKLSSLEPGVPRMVMISDQRIDAWTRYPERPVGTVWLVRRDNNRVDAYSGTCPHLGCPVNYESAEGLFVCPCHHGVYAADGSRISGPQLRGLDALQSKLERVRGDDWVSVIFERFELGIPEKIQVG